MYDFTDMLTIPSPVREGLAGRTPRDGAPRGNRERPASARQVLPSCTKETIGRWSAFG